MGSDVITGKRNLRSTFTDLFGSALLATALGWVLGGIVGYFSAFASYASAIAVMAWSMSILSQEGNQRPANSWSPVAVGVIAATVSALAWPILTSPLVNVASHVFPPAVGFILIGGWPRLLVLAMALVGQAAILATAAAMLSTGRASRTLAVVFFGTFAVVIIGAAVATLDQDFRVEALSPSSDHALCSPAYPAVCVPAYPPDLDCSDLRPVRGFGGIEVSPPDPHGLDADGDGWGCEPYPR